MSGLKDIVSMPNKQGMWKIKTHMQEKNITGNVGPLIKNNKIQNKMKNIEL